MGLPGLMIRPEFKLGTDYDFHVDQHGDYRNVDNVCSMYRMSGFNGHVTDMEDFHKSLIGAITKASSTCRKDIFGVDNWVDAMRAYRYINGFVEPYVVTPFSAYIAVMRLNSAVLAAMADKQGNAQDFFREMGWAEFYVPHYAKYNHGMYYFMMAPDELVRKLGLFPFKKTEENKEAQSST